MLELDSEEKFSNLDIKGGEKPYKLLHFFASWCGVCKKEHPDMMILSQHKNIEIIGVAWKNKAKTVNNWLGQKGNPYDRILIDRVGGTKHIFGLAGVPESFLIDDQNIIVVHFRGPINLENIYEVID